MARDSSIIASIADWSKKSHAQVIERIRSAMLEIEREIAANEGSYPSRLSISEVCRRAGVDRATLEKATHKTTTLVEVSGWLGGLRSRLTRGTKARHSAATKLAETYKCRLNVVCQKYHEAELEMVSLRGEVERLKAHIAAVVTSNVVSMRRRGEK